MSHGAPTVGRVDLPDPQLAAWLDQQDQLVCQHIREHGVHLEYVYGCTQHRQTSFCYTVGLFGIGQPELLVIGVPMATSGALLNEVARQVYAGRQLVPGEVLSFAEWAHRVCVEPVPNPGEIVFAANRHYDRPAEASVPVLQLTTDDRWGRFPWDEGYAIPAWVQPRPGEFSAWS